jgi:hypothetical protein
MYSAFTQEYRAMLGAMMDVPRIAFSNYEEIIQNKDFKQKILKVSKEGSIDIVSGRDRDGRDSQDYDRGTFEINGPDLSQAIVYDSYKCLPFIDLSFRYINGEVLELKMCMEGIALDIFKYLFDKGYKMSYFSTTRLILLIRKSFKNFGGENSKDSNFELQKVNPERIIYLEMLKYAISKGLRMDLHQLALLTAISTELSQEIEELYSSPLWVKSCAASDNVPLPQAIKELAYSLNLGIKEYEKRLDDERFTSGGGQETREQILKQSICMQLKNMSQVLSSDGANRAGVSDGYGKEYVSANITKQRNRLKSEVLSSTQEMTSAVVNAPVSCANTTKDDKSLKFMGNPLDYSEGALVFYKDKAGKNWCFTPNMYSDLIKTQTNVYTNERIPTKVIGKMINILEYMQILNIDPSKITSVSKGIDKLNEPDMISNEYTDLAVNYLINTASLRGIYPETLRSLSYEKMQYILDMIGYRIDYFRDLKSKISPSLAFSTFCKAIYVYMRSMSDLQRLEAEAPGLDEIFEVLGN